MPDLFNRKRLEVVLLQEIVCAEAKQLKSDANMTVIVERVQHSDTIAFMGKKNTKSYRLLQVDKVSDQNIKKSPWCTST